MKNLVSLIRTSFLWLLLLPYFLIYTGAASNQAVIIANHNRFPVMVNSVKLSKFVNTPEDVETLLSTDMIDAVHCTMTRYTHLNALADIFDIDGNIYSVGDFAIEAGEGMQTPLFFAWLALILYKISEKSSRRVRTAR